MNESAIREVINALNELGIPYMAVGSLSSNVYGVARLTKDADFVVRLAPGHIAALRARLAPGLRLDSQPTLESATLTTRYVLETATADFTIELFDLSDDPHDQERFQRRREGDLIGGRVWVPTPEDVIITKLRWYAAARRRKDWDDVYGILAVQGDRLDWAYIESWCDRHGSREYLDQLRTAVSPPGG